MAGNFQGKAVVVTGASSGLGRFIAVELAKHGAECWLVGRNASELEETARLIAEASGPTAHAAPMDLAQRGPLAALIEEVGRKHPHLFALIGNAGVMYPEPILKGTVERWQHMIDINVMAVLEGSKAAIEVMRRHKKPGHIINVSSMQGHFEEPGVYGVTKAGVEMIGATLRDELEQDDIRVCTIIPGGFQTQLARGLLPEELASIVDKMKASGLEFGAPGTERLMGDPQHIANVTRYILEQPIELNIQEVMIRPAVSLKIK
ncbi:MAG: SDR family NAD(P)-dependent oxidoreductase [Caulobacterales bacterium]